MIINNQQAIQTLDILCAKHRKVINEHLEKYPLTNSDEVNKLADSSKALYIYNSFKKNYQPTIK